MYLKEFRYAKHSYISTASSFGPLFGPPSDLYTRTHKRNYTIIYAREETSL